MPAPRHVAAAAAAAAAEACVLVATVWVAAFAEGSRDITAFAERGLSAPVLAALVVVAALVPWGVLVRSEGITGALGLALAGAATLLPLWAAWPDLDPRWRALALAAGPLAVAGFAVMVRSWPGCLLSTAAALLHALAYDPFRDPGCSRVCLEVPTLIAVPTGRLTLMVSGLLAVAAALVLARARRRHAVAPAVGAVAIAVLWAVRWAQVGDSDVPAAVLLAAVLVPGLVALPYVFDWVGVARRRAAAQHLALQLAEDPARLLTAGDDLDLALLAPAQRLALRNAQLAVDALHRVAEVQESQRRIVAAADAERWRIERDLHDGTQQRLVGVLLQLAGLGMHEVEDQVRGVLAELRSFSHGTFPAVLDDEGLEVALAELAAISRARIRLDVHLPAPVPAEHGRAVYALVALADSGDVDVSMCSRQDGLHVVVTGLEGVDPVHVGDRFGALGGTLTASGGTIEGWLPCAW